MSRLILAEIRSYLELRLSAFEIAQRLCINVNDVKLAIDNLKKLKTA